MTSTASMGAKWWTLPGTFYQPNTRTWELGHPIYTQGKDEFQNTVVPGFSVLGFRSLP